MTDILRWFHNLEFAERSSVTAVVDDGNFLSFYMNLLRDEYQQPNDDKNHALFMADYLSALFERARKRKSSPSANECCIETQQSSNSTAGTDGLSNESSLLSFLNSGRISGNDMSDFDDPYVQSFCSDLGVLKTNGDTNLSAISPSIQAVESLKCLGSRIPNIRKELTETMARRQGVQLAISDLMKTAVLNVANKLGNQQQVVIADRIQRIDEISEVQQNDTALPGGKAELDHFAIAANLHSSISVSFATSGTDSFDCLFLMRPVTEDSNCLIEKFLLLSRGQMFSNRPTPQYVKAALSGKSLPMMSWLADCLSPPFNSTRSCAVPYYMLLLSRIELAMWSAFFSICENKGSGAVSALSGIDAEFDGEVGSFSNIALLPRSVRQNGKNSVTVAVAPVRNSLRVLERSTLYQLSCTAVMLSLGCITEEWKAVWRILPTADLLRIVSEHPRLKVFYSNPKNGRGRSETIVDRLVLCPLAWVMNLADERRAKCTYRRLESAISSITAGSNNCYNGDQINSSAESLTNELRVAEKSRAGLVKFDETAKRTGAVPHTSGHTEAEVEASAELAVEAVKGAVVRLVARPEEGARHRGSALGLTKRTVTRPPPVTSAAPVPMPLPVPPLATVISAQDSRVVEIATGDYEGGAGDPLFSLSSAVSENSVERSETYSGCCDDTLPASRSKKAKKAKQKATALMATAIDAGGQILHDNEGVSHSSGDSDLWDASSARRGDDIAAHSSLSSHRSHYTALATTSTVHYSVSHSNGHGHFAEVSGSPPSGRGRSASPTVSAVAPGYLPLSKGTVSNVSRQAPPPLKHISSATILDDSQIHGHSALSRKNVPFSNSPPVGPLQDPDPLSGDVRAVVDSSQRQRQCGDMMGCSDGRMRETRTGTEPRAQREQDMALEDHFLSSAGEGDMSASQRTDTSPKVDRGKKSTQKPLHRIVPSDGLGTAYSTERIRGPLHSPRSPVSVSGEGRFQDNNAAPPVRNKTPDEDMHLAVSFPTSPSSSSSFKSFNSYEVCEGGKHVDPVRFKGGKHGDAVRCEIALQMPPQLLSTALKGPHPPYPSPASPRHSGNAGDDRPHPGTGPGPGPAAVIVSPIASEWGKQGATFVRPPDSWGQGPTGQYTSGDCRTPVRTMSLGREPVDSGNRSQRLSNIDAPPGFHTFSSYSPHGYTGSHERSEAPHTYTDNHRYHHNGGNSDVSSHNGNNNVNMYNKCDNLGSSGNNSSGGNNRGYGDYSYNNQAQGHSDMAPRSDYRMIDRMGYDNPNHNNIQSNIQNNNNNSNNYNTINNFNYINNLNNIQNGSNGMSRDRDRERDIPQSQSQSSSTMLKSRNLLRSAPYREREIAPKVSKDAALRLRATVKLHKSVTKNIRSFNNIMSGRMEVHKLTRIALYLELRSMVTSLWPSAAVHIFGSCITGLALPSSDIDIVIQLTRQPGLRVYQPQPPTQTPFQYSPQRPLYYQDQRPLSPGQYFQYPHSPLNLRPQPRTPTHMPVGPDEWGESPKGGRARVKAQTVVNPGDSSAHQFEGDSHRPEAVETAARSPARISSTDSGNLDPGIQVHPVPQLVYPSPSPSPFAREKTSPTPLSPTPTRSPRSPAPPADFPSPGHYIPGMGLPQPPAGPTPEMFNSLFFALTSQLYMQVWASQVNPIPSATVPVIKLRVAADALLSNPAMQQAVFAAHQQQMLSPILEPTMFTLPVMHGQEYGSSPMHYPSSFPSISSSGLVSRESSGSLGGIARERALSAFEDHLADRATYPRQNGGTDPEQQRAGQTALGLEHFNGNSYQPQQMQQMQQPQQQQFSYPPQTVPFSGPTPHGVRPADHGHSVLGGAGPYPYTTPFFAMLPFHLAAGVGIAVDITIENGQHKGLSTCEFVQQSLSTRSAVLPAVVKVVKALLVQSKLNVPFLGGLSSYSAFLLVLAAYDRCQNSDARNTFASRGKGVPSSPSASNLYSDGDGFCGGSVGGSTGIGSGAGSSLPITEGEVFMHFLALFASSSQGFNSASQGIDVRCEPYMLSDLTPDQQVTIIGGGLWIVDPLDSTKNVARPSFAFRHAQQYFRQCLDKIEGAAAGTALSGPDAQAFDFLKLLMRF